MLVIIGWLSFFLNRNAFKFRGILCGIILLAMVFGLSQLPINVPKTSYTKSLDIYAGVCMTFVFIAVIGEF